MTTTLTPPVLWTPDQPNRCACADTYQPELTERGKLVKKYEPAYRMAEQTRSRHCLQERCRACSKRYPIRYQHHADSRKSDAGYPDVHIWAPGGRGSVYIELKRMDKNPTPVQVEVMASLVDAGHRVYLCRPCCLLCGVVDQIMADLAGVEPYDRHTPAVLPATNVLPAAPELAATPRPPRQRRPEPQLPGTEPPGNIPKAVGYLVPMTAAATDPEAMRELEGWLRAAGFPPAVVPFPMRIVAGRDQLIVLVRAADTRVWRGGHTRTPFPKLAERLHADVFHGPYSFVRELIEHAVPAADLPDKP